MSFQECLAPEELAYEEFVRLLNGCASFTLTEDQYSQGIVSLPKDKLAIFWVAFDELKKKGCELSYNQASIGFFSAAARLKLLDIKPN